MVDTSTLNGDSRLSTTRQLPEVVIMSKADLAQFPSPGTQRALRAETGKDYLAMVGPDADSADRTQTQVWTKLRKTIRDLRWEECEDVALQIDDGEAPDPLLLSVSAISPASVDSGG